MPTVQVLDLIARARQRADQESFLDRFPDAEVLDYVNLGIAEFYEYLVAAEGYSYFGVDYPITTTGALNYPLPQNFFKLSKVTFSASGGNTIYELERLNEVDEASLRSRIGQSFPQFYRVRAGVIDVFPAVPAGATLTLSYVPTAPALQIGGSTGTDTLDSINRWDEFAAIYAARRMALKDSDFELANMLQQDLTRQTERLVRMAADRDIGRPQRVQDIRGAVRRSRYGRYG